MDVVSKSLQLINSSIDEYCTSMDIKYTTVERWFDDISIDTITQQRILNYPQRSQLWLQARRRRITASNFGKAINLSRYGNRKSILKQMVTNKSIYVNSFMQWGIDHEIDGVRVFTSFMQQLDPDCRLKFPGLVVPRSFPFTGVSPDGLVLSEKLFGGEYIGLEIKCPKVLYTSIPVEYYCQIQGTMGLLGLRGYFFVIWTPSECVIEFYKFDEPFYRKKLLPGLIEFYFHHYLPNMLKQPKLILENIDPSFPF